MDKDTEEEIKKITADLGELGKTDFKKLATNVILMGVIIIFLIFLVIGFTLSVLTTLKDTCDDTRKRAAAGNITLASIQFMSLAAAVGYYIYLSRDGSIDVWAMSYLVMMMLGSFVQLTTAGMVADDNKQAESAQGLMTTTGIMMLISIFYFLISYFYVRSNIRKAIAVATAGENVANRKIAEATQEYDMIQSILNDFMKS